MSNNYSIALKNPEDALSDSYIRNKRMYNSSLDAINDAYDLSKEQGNVPVNIKYEGYNHIEEKPFEVTIMTLRSPEVDPSTGFPKSYKKDL